MASEATLIRSQEPLKAPKRMRHAEGELSQIPSDHQFGRISLTKSLQFPLLVDAV